MAVDFRKRTRRARHVDAELAAGDPAALATAARETAALERFAAQLERDARPAPRPALHIDHEITVWCEARGRERWFARLWDRATAQHCGGAGDTALEAIAWCMDSYVRRALLGLPALIACHPNARPGDGLELEAA